MKTLVLNGSPKGDRSDCMHMTRAFVKGMKSVDESMEIQTINVIDKDIKFCKGCLTCMHNGGKCVIDDDMKEILPLFQDADTIIMSFPLYCYSMPALMKNLIERILPLSSINMVKQGERYRHTAQADITPKKYVVICGSGFPNSKGNFEPVISQFHLMFPPDSLVITVPEAPMFNAPAADPVTKPFLKILEQAGLEFMKEGKVSEATMAKIAVPMIPQEVYASIVNGTTPV